ncbi:MAG: GNAT family N-acetyltransferase [Polyangiaceae bacterium]|nr:GNAT family N-acetyltransferase [Polyangiaceae bacterium]
MIEYKIINREVCHMQGVAELYGCAHPNSAAKTAQYFVDKHFHNPVNDGVIAGIALDGDRIVGTAFFVSGEYLYQNKTYKSALACDYMVHPDYQRRGISTRLTRLVEDYLFNRGYDFLTTFPNNKSKTGFLRNQWKEIFTFDYFILPCFFPSFLSYSFSGSTIWKDIRAMKNVSALKIGSADILNEDDYAMLNGDGSRFRLKRSRELYNFKFNEEYMKYYYVKITESNKVKLLLTAREDIRRVKGIRLKFIGIVDYNSFCEDFNDEIRCFACAIAELRKKGHAIVVWESTSKRFNDQLVNLLKFMSLSKLHVGKSKHYYLTKRLNPQMPSEVESAKHWDLQWVEADL